MIESTKESNEELLKSAFNGSIQTLDRINELIIHISAYTVNGHVMGMKENLRELLIEAQGFLSKVELKKARQDWAKIEITEIIINDDGTVTYDSNLRMNLINFSSWIRLKLHKHNVTMAGKRDYEDGLKNLRNKYGL